MVSLPQLSLADASGYEPKAMMSIPVANRPYRPGEKPRKRRVPRKRRDEYHERDETYERRSRFFRIIRMFRGSIVSWLKFSIARTSVEAVGFLLPSRGTIRSNRFVVVDRGLSAILAYQAAQPERALRWSASSTVPGGRQVNLGVGTRYGRVKSLSNSSPLPMARVARR